MKNTMAVNQYGETFHALGAHPRKALLEKFGRKHAAKMYRDKKDGSSVHVGYIIAGQWLELFSVQSIENKA